MEIYGEFMQILKTPSLNRISSTAGWCSVSGLYANVAKLVLQNTVDKLVQRANASLLIGTSSWKEQFVEDLTVSPSNEDNEKQPSTLDYCMHFVTLFWKILFAFVPPTGKLFTLF